MAQGNYIVSYRGIPLAELFYNSYDSDFSSVADQADYLGRERLSALGIRKAPRKKFYTHAFSPDNQYTTDFEELAREISLAWRGDHFAKMDDWAEEDLEKRIAKVK